MLCAGFDCKSLFCEKMAIVEISDLEHASIYGRNNLQTRVISLCQGATGSVLQVTFVQRLDGVMKTVLCWIKANMVMLSNAWSLVGTTAVTSGLGFA